MPIYISISNQKTQYLNADAINELEDCGRKYIDELLDEADKLEAAGKMTNVRPEITSNHIRVASIYKSGRFIRLKKKPLAVIGDVVSMLLFGLAGTLFDLDKFTDPGRFFPFLVILIISIILKMLVLFTE
ncbi:MAG: hypothetical protein AB9891_14765 [Anaerolineaceae bacterium]